MALSAGIEQEVLRNVQVVAPDHRKKGGVTCGVSTSSPAQIVIRLNVRIPGRSLICRREGYGRRASAVGVRLEVHLGGVAGNVNQIITGVSIPVRVAREEIARVVLVSFEDRRHGRNAELEVFLPGGGGNEKPL